MLRTLLRGLRRVLVWTGPTLVLLLAVASGFLTWTLTTAQGSRWLLITAVRAVDGQVHEVQGSVLYGLRIGSLALSLPDVSVQARALQLDVNWWALWERRLHIQNLSAQSLALSINTAASPAPSNMSTVLPIPVVLDRLALGRLEVRVNGAPLPLRVDALALAAHVTRERGQLAVQQLTLAHALGNAALQADVTWQWDGLVDGPTLTALDVDAQLLDGTHWNGQALQGTLHLQARHVGARSAALRDVVQTWTLPAVRADLTLGDNHVVLDGAFGNATDGVSLQAHIPAMEAFWPQLAGSLQVQGQLGGGAMQHTAALDLRFTPAAENGDRLADGQAGSVSDDQTAMVVSTPVAVSLALTGTWERPGQRDQAWQARITQWQVEYAALQIDALAPLALRWQPQASAWPWTIDAVPLRLSLDRESLFILDHQQTLFGNGRWQTRGGVAQLHVTDARIGRLSRQLPPAWREILATVSVHGDATQPGIGHDLHVSADWQLGFRDTLEGTVNLRRTAGDLVIPWEPPIPMGLQALTLNLEAVRSAAGLSQLRATAALDTATMGTLMLRAHTQLRGDWQLESPGNTRIDVHSNMADLAWLNLFTTLPVELGGGVTAQLSVAHRADGRWTTQGRVTGTDIRIVYLDEGVRLLDGTLAARFDDEHFVLESLQFPARLRVEPAERRTRAWIGSDSDAQHGSLTASGAWHLRDQAGQVDVRLQRYSLLQRADRHAMLSGSVRVKVENDARALVMTGDLTADAGWVDLDMVGGVPTLDSDVVVRRAGDASAPATPSAMASAVSLDINIDLGSRFYLTGYGLDSGLEGQLRLRMQDGRLRADGALHTRGGTVNAYGQQLQLQRGSVTFQGDVASPVLDVAAVRAGDLAVQAGVRVAGTARRPRIDLISTPEVNDVEKLSWLLFGRGSDQSGGDAALLLSVGSSFFTAGEPFYRQFGLDELGLRSGALGASGSLLPVESVVRSLDAGVSDIERQFIVASKNISQDFTLSVEQALSDTGTVGRISYRLARGLNASITLGTVNGLALVYRWFSRD